MSAPDRTNDAPESSKPRFLTPIMAMTLGAVAVAYVCSFILGTPTPTLYQTYLGLSIIALILVASLALFSFTVALLLSGDRRPLPKVWKRVRLFASVPLLAEKILPILLVFAFFGAFNQLKALIPHVHPFAWDGTFSDLDRMIFGTDPWRLTHAFFGPFATRILDAVYLFWFPVLTAVLFYYSVFAPDDQKRRFFLSFFAIWIIIGLVAATIFSSAGPCFLALIGDPNAARYAEMFPTSPRSQAAMYYLAELHRSGRVGVGNGISAMPSLHVGVAFLYVLAARSRIMQCVAAAYFAVILVGSVHLGWHYAVDGIAASAGVAVIWWATRTTPRLRFTQPFPLSRAPVVAGIYRSLRHFGLVSPR